MGGQAEYIIPNWLWTAGEREEYTQGVCSGLSIYFLR